MSQPLENYHRHPNCVGGRIWRCKDCVTKYLQEPKVRRRRALYERERRRRPDVARYVTEYGRRPEVRKRALAYAKRHLVEDGEYALRHRIRDLLKAAVKGGRVEKPCCCSVCGRAETRIEGHHHNGYAKAHWLDVVWLCHGCHAEAHNLIRDRRAT